MTALLYKFLPAAASLVAIALGIKLLGKKDKSLLHKAILHSTPAVVLLQIGTYMLGNCHAALHLLGGQIVILSLCLLTPLCSRLALLWGQSRGREVLRKSRPLLFSQWVIGLVFTALIPSGNFLHLASSEPEAIVAYGSYGRYFLIYLVVSSVLVLSVFESKRRLCDNIAAIRIPTLVFMGMFVFFIIGASQGLMIGTLHTFQLLMVSLCVLMGYLAPLAFRLKSSTNLPTLPDNRQFMYSSFMIVIVGTYLILIGIFGKLVASLGGDVNIFFSVVAAVATAIFLFMIATSLTLKQKLSTFIDRTLYRNKFDYRAIWSKFSEETSFSLTLDELTDAILGSVVGTLQAASGAILLTDDETSSLNLVKKKAWRLWTNQI
ncbi:MAG: hypothetical protein ACE5IY_12015 [bacterium]